MIYTFPREAVEQGLRLTEPYALISISTPKVYGWETYADQHDDDRHGPSLPADVNRVDILRLAFWDVDALSPEWPDTLKAQARLYSTEDARRVAAFVREYRGLNIVIHCDAGISRSQGMANAIALYLGITKVKHSVQGFPNHHVYTLTWTALNAVQPGRCCG